MLDTFDMLQIFALVFHVFCCRRGLYNTGILFIFWLLYLLCDVITFRSLIIQYPVSFLEQRTEATFAGIAKAILRKKCAYMYEIG